MSDQWYYRMFGEEFGPVAFEKLREMADHGTVGSSDEVRSARSTRWVPAGSVEKLGLSPSGGGTAVATASDSDAAVNAVSDRHRAGLDDWYCLANGHELGPLNFDELLKFAQQEQITADDEVKLGANGKWRRVGSIGRLMAVLPYRAIERNIPRPAGRLKTPALGQPVVSSRVRSVSPTTTGAVPVAAVDRNVADQVAYEPAGTGSQPQLAAVTAALRRDSIKPAVQPPVVERPSVAPAATPRQPLASSAFGTSSPSLGSSASSMSSGSSFGSNRPIITPARPAFKPQRSRSASSSFSLAEMLEPLKEPKALGAVGVVAAVLLGFGWMSLPKSSAADVKNFHELKHIVDEIKQKRSSNSTDFVSVNTQAERIRKSVIADVAKQASRDEPAKQQLLWAARDRMPAMLGALKKTPAESSKAEQGFIECLREAARLLNIKDDGLPPAPPRPPVDPNAPQTIDD